jgi:hypothetical protein
VKGAGEADDSLRTDGTEGMEGSRQPAAPGQLAGGDGEAARRQIRKAKHRRPAGPEHTAKELPGRAQHMAGSQHEEWSGPHAGQDSSY